MPEQPRSGPIQFRDVRLQPDLECRSRRGESLGTVASRDLERYYDLLRRELLTLNLTEAEANAILDANNGTIWEPHTIPLVWANVADALDDGLTDRWDVNGGHLVDRLRRLTPGQAVALVDAIERFWASPASGDQTEHLRLLGLIR